MARRFFALCSLLAMLAIAVAAMPTYAVYLDEGDTAQQEPAALSSGLIARSAGSTKAAPVASDESPGVYIVQLTDPPVAQYVGGVPGLRGTSASATGRSKIDADSPATEAYVQYLDQRQGEVLAAVAGVVGDTVRPLFSYRYAINGFAATFTPEQAAAIAALPGVNEVQRERVWELQTDRGPSFIGAAQAEDLRPALFKAALSGAQEVPPVATEAAGEAVVNYDAASNTLTFRVSYAGLSAAPVMAHFHIGAPGATGGVVIDIFDTAVGTAGTSGSFIGSKTIADVGAPLNLTAQQIEDALFAGNLYLNVHTPANPSGEIRGQVTASRGEGMLVGIIDGGINPTHPSFADVGADGYDHSNPLGAGSYLGVCNNTDDDGRFDAAFTCNDKLIGAYTFEGPDARPDPQGAPSPRDDDGHGSHTASTTAGNVLTTSTVNGANTGPITGVAPHANIIAYDVCGTATSATACVSSAMLGAIDQATANGVDVINMSIGSDSSDPWGDFESLSLLAALDSGVFAALSIGNDGPDASTTGSSGNSPWVTGTAATTHDRVFINALQNFAGGNAGTRPTTLTGKGVSGGLATTSIIYAGDAGNALCGPFDPPEAAQVTGKIVVCDRGTFGRVEKAENVQAAGGVGYVLANDAASGNSLVGDAYPIPGVHLTFNDGVALKAWLTGCADCQASISGATADIDPAYGDVMASFSSRGPDASIPGILKPDLAAPGVDILAASADFDAAAADFQFISGTSMASPHVAGAATLLRQIHPDWTPAEVKSALMSTGITNLLKEDGTTEADPFDYGGGRIDVARAALAGLVFDETAETMFFADPFIGGDPSTLNFASAASEACVVTCTFTRTVRNTLGVAAEWTASSTAPTSLTLSVEPNSFSLAPDATQTFTITANAGAATLNEGYVFGRITLTPDVAGIPATSLPVVIQPAASDLAERIEIATATTEGSKIIPIRSVLASDLTPEVFGLVRTTPVSVTLAPDPTPSDPLDSTEGVTIRQVTLPATTTRYHVHTANATALDLDLFVYQDGLVDPADGVPQEEELVCASATSSADEFCDIDNSGDVFGQPVTLLVLVQNWEGSGAATDSFLIYSGTVGNTAAGNLTVTTPETNPLGGTFELTLNYNLGEAEDGDLFVGVIQLSSTAAADGDLGYALVDVLVDEFELFAPLVRK